MTQPACRVKVNNTESRAESYKRVQKVLWFASDGCVFCQLWTRLPCRNISHIISILANTINSVSIALREVDVGMHVPPTMPGALSAALRVMTVGPALAVSLPST